MSGKTFKHLCRIFVLLVLTGAVRALHAQTWMADNGDGSYSNPLFYDEFADPDIVRVGADFYLVGSSMHAMPGLALLHSRDLVNWEFISYALDRLDLGPAYRLEHGENIYGQGIWAPSLRFHNGTFYIFANVNGQTTQMFQARDPRGPWKQIPMKRSFHDLSVLFDEDGKTYVVWGYADIRIAELNAELTDIIPGTERLLIGHEQGMGEGLHLYKIGKRYYLLSAWYNGVMRMPVARSDTLNGPWEVNRDISVGEQFGQVPGWRLDSFRPPLSTVPPYTILPPDPSGVGRMAIHQGGIVDTPTGEWWGLSMGEENAIGRVVTLSPITWTDGWPYFGLPGNLGRTPRMWVKPNTGTVSSPHAPYERSDDFSGRALKPVWQWNHVPADGQWSLAERPGFLRLHALAARNLWDARDTLTQRAVGPQSIATVKLDAENLQTGDRAGLALLIQPEVWVGVEKTAAEFVVVQYDGQRAREERRTVRNGRIWLRADCDFASQLAHLSFSTDGVHFETLGEPFRMVTIGVTFQGVRYALFSYHRGAGAGGFADFDDFSLQELHPHGITRPIPYGRAIELALHGGEPHRVLVREGATLRARTGRGSALTVVDRHNGQVALRDGDAFVSVAPDGSVTLKAGEPDTAETFQWIETFTGELTLMSLANHRYLSADLASGEVRATSAGPEPDGSNHVRFDWR